MQISKEAMFQEQRNDDNITTIIENITSENPDAKFKNYFIHPDSGLLMIRKFSQAESNLNGKIIVPASLKPKILKIAHMPHFGIYNTYRKILKGYYWRGVYQDTKNYVLSCDLCIKSKPHKIPAAPLQEMFIPKVPGELVSMDFLGPFTNGMHVLTVLDHFSKFVELFPITSPSAQSVVDSLMKYITTFGRPASVMSDLGPQFTAQIFNHFMETLKISIVHSSSAHPQTQGSSERINTSIKSSIATLTKEGFNFKQAVMIHKSIYNTTVHSSTGYSPAFLHFGRSISHIYDLYELPDLSAMDFPFEYYQHMSSMKGIYEKVYDNMKQAQNERNLRQHDKAKLRKFVINDLVYVKSRDTFKSRFTGPFSVVNILSDVLVTIKEFENELAKPFNINIDRLLLVQQRKEHLKLPSPSVSNVADTSTEHSASQPQDSNVQPKHRYNLRSHKNTSV